MGNNQYNSALKHLDGVCRCKPERGKRKRNVLFSTCTMEWNAKIPQNVRSEHGVIMGTFDQQTNRTEKNICLQRVVWTSIKGPSSFCLEMAHFDPSTNCSKIWYQTFNDCVVFVSFYWMEIEVKWNGTLFLGAALKRQNAEQWVDMEKSLSGQVARCQTDCSMTGWALQQPVTVPFEHSHSQLHAAQPLQPAATWRHYDQTIQLNTMQPGTGVCCLNRANAYNKVKATDLNDETIAQDNFGMIWVNIG